MNEQTSGGAAWAWRCGLAMAAGLMWVAGCTGRPDPTRGRLPGLPKDPPAYPAAHRVELDPQLLAAAHQELTSGLRSNDPSIRAHALEALTDAVGTAAASDVIAALNDPDPLVRYAACLAVGQLKLADTHDRVLQLAGDADTRVRVVARYALHRLGDTHLSHELEKLSQDPEAAVRGTTAMVLGLIGEPSALKVLRPMQYDPYAPVRQQAAESMWRLGSEQGLKDLVGWTVSRYHDDQMIAYLALAAPRDRRVLGQIRGGLTTDNLEVNLAAARAMGELGCDRGYGVALQGVPSADPRPRLLAAMALGAIGRTDAQDTLRKLMADPDQNVRIAAAEALLQLKPDLVIQC